MMNLFITNSLCAESLIHEYIEALNLISKNFLMKRVKFCSKIGLFMDDMEMKFLVINTLISL